ncbi:T9SS type A sorting domain-containing protein [candidate division KSB1 bacterium]|nr:T9SS type A sorting domain-containing protein [candidate division KSB1 bacterium]
MIIKVIKTTILFLLLTKMLSANPVIVRNFSEILLDTTNWAIELSVGMGPFDIFDSCYLNSESGTAKFKNGLFINNYGMIIVTRDSLENDFSFNPFGDKLTLRTSSGEIFDQIEFGIIDGDTVCVTKIGQSICTMGGTEYLDNTPTIGNYNDTLNATGIIQGTVTDSSGQPCENINLFYLEGSNNDYGLVCDSTGYFSINVIATTIIFTNYYDNYEHKRYNVHAYPESTITVHLIFNKLQDSVEPINRLLSKDYFLSNNYPNPFNSTTFFNYKIPIDDFVEINVYDIKGGLVENLHSGFQGKGEYRLMWDAFAAPSGMYIIRLRTPQVVLNKKCMLVK